MQMSDMHYPKLFYGHRNRQYHILEPFKHEMAFFISVLMS